MTSPTEIEFSEIISYLNKKTGKNFRVTDKARKLLRARFAEGYEMEHFKQAIDNKSEDDFYIKSPNYYAPTTMFNGNFDARVNDTRGKKKEEKDEKFNKMMRVCVDYQKPVQIAAGSVHDSLSPQERVDMIHYRQKLLGCAKEKNTVVLKELYKKAREG